LLLTISFLASGTGAIDSHVSFVDSPSRNSVVGVGAAFRDSVRSDLAAVRLRSGTFGSPDASRGTAALLVFD
jgi:hypothetical protein